MKIVQNSKAKLETKHSFAGGKGAFKITIRFSIYEILHANFSSTCAVYASPQTQKLARPLYYVITCRCDSIESYLRILACQIVQRKYTHTLKYVLDERLVLGQTLQYV